MADCCSNINDCGGLTYSTNCVLFAGDDISSPAIGNGDNITTIIQTFATDIDNLLNGKDILLPDVDLTQCAIINTNLGSKTKNLTNVLQVLVEYQCTLKDLIDGINATDTFAFDTKCLTVASTKTKDDIIQANINQTCTNKSDIASLKTTTTTNTSDIKTLKTQVATILGTEEDSSAPVFTFSQLCPSHVALPYFGDLNNFDSTGKGYSNKGFDKVYIMNGNNGTIDMRGYSIMGANSSAVSGGNLDSRVDPSNTNFTLGPNAKAGEVNHTLSVKEIPSHTHTVTDPGHSHTYIAPKLNQGHPSGSKDSEARHNQTISTSSSKTGITLASTGGGSAHNNIPPVIGAVWIIKIP